METKQKVKSVTRTLIIVMAILITVYNLAVLEIMRQKIKSGFTGYMKNQIIEQSVIFQQEIKSTEVQLYSTAVYVKQAYEDQTSRAGYDLYFTNALCEKTVKLLDADEIIFFDADGKIISSNKYGTTDNLNFVREALTGKEVQRLVKEGSWYYAEAALPVQYNGKIQGAVLAKKRACDNQLLSTVAAYTTCDATIFDGYKRAYTTLTELKGKEIDDHSIIDRVMKGEEVFLLTKLDGHNYMAYYYPLKDDDGNVVTSLFLGKATAGIDHVSENVTEQLFLIITAAGILFLGATISLIIISVMKPVKEIGKAIENLASGDADLTARIHIHGNNEFAKMGNDVNKFIENLQEMVKELVDTHQKINQIGEQLGTNAQESASATAEILANIEGVRKQSENQSGAVQNTSSVLNQSSISVNALSEMINSQAQGISESSAQIEEMLDNINAVTENVRRMSEDFRKLDVSVETGDKKLKDVVTKVLEISEQSKMLSQANAIISQIASETNLLAMNAAIEAAHAGESGKGFSVVADEIRKLAETSSQQSKNINAKLREVTSSIQNVVVLSQESQATFAEIVDRLESTNSTISQIDTSMNEQSEASHQILNSLGTMKNQSNEVQVKSKELSDGVVNVTNDMQTVSQISDVILGSMDEMSAGAGQISSSSQSVSDLAAQTAENLKTMEEQLKKFKA